MIMLDIETLIIQQLQKGETSKVSLIHAIQSLRANTTKQGVYKALRKLESEEKIIFHRKEVALNLKWVFDTQEFMSLAQFYYSKPTSNPISILSVDDKSKLAYSFKTLAELDSFWNQSLYILNEAVAPHEPLFAYNPHQWFFYARNKYEQSLLKNLKKYKRPVLVTLFHQDQLNKSLKRSFDPSIVQYAFAKKLISEKSNYYFNVVSDFLIQAYIDPTISQKLDKFFTENTVLSKQAQDTINAIIHTKGKHKLIISRDARKALALKRSLSRKFDIKQ